MRPSLDGAAAPASDDSIRSPTRTPVPRIALPRRHDIHQRASDRRSAAGDALQHRVHDRARHRRLRLWHGDDVVAGREAAGPVDAAIIGRGVDGRCVAHAPGHRDPPVDTHGCDDGGLARFVDDRAGDHRVLPEPDADVRHALAVADVDGLGGRARPRLSARAAEVAVGIRVDDVAALQQVADHEPAVCAGDQPNRSSGAAGPWSARARRGEPRVHHDRGAANRQIGADIDHLAGDDARAFRLLL